MTNPLDAINALVNSATTSSTMRWLVCRDCAHIQAWDMATMPPAACPKCGSQSRITASTEAIALDMAAKVPGAKASPTTPPVAPAPVAEQPAPVTPAPEKLEPAAAPEKPKRGRKPAAPSAEEAKAQVNAFNEGVASGAIPLTPENIPSTVTESELDWGRKREIARDQLFAKFPSINAATWTKVTEGKIQTFGFGATVEGVWHSDWMEVSDTPQAFAERFKEAKKSEPGLSVDLAKVAVCPADEEAFTPFAFAGFLTCSLRPLFRETVRPTVGARVTVGARLSKNGKLTFAVMEVKR